MVACILFVALQLIQATFVYWLLNKKLRDAEREHEQQQRVEEDMRTLFVREVPAAVQRIYNESEVNLRRRRRVRIVHIHMTSKTNCKYEYHSHVDTGTIQCD